MQKRDYFQLGVGIILLQVIGFALGILTKNNIPLWYNDLIKSTLTPPPIIFALVWPLLYVLLACVGWMLWRQKSNPDMRLIGYLFLVQLLMNWLWTPLFFQLHWIGFSFLWIVLLTALTFVITYKLAFQNMIMSLILIPYCLWLIFATYLNGVIWAYN